MSDVLLRHHPELAPALDGCRERVRAMEPTRLERGLRARELPVRASACSRTRRFNALVIVPNAAQGIFRRRRPAVAAATAANVDGQAVGLLGGWRAPTTAARSGSASSATRRCCLLDARRRPPRARRLARPVRLDPKPKRNGMAAFQPDAVTISRGETWRKRRAFNETVIDTGALRGRRAPLRHRRRRRGGGARDRVLAGDDEIRLGALERRLSPNRPPRDPRRRRRRRRRALRDPRRDDVGGERDAGRAVERYPGLHRPARVLRRRRQAGQPRRPGSAAARRPATEPAARSRTGCSRPATRWRSTPSACTCADSPPTR